MAGRHERPDIVVVIEDRCGCMSECVAEHLGRIYSHLHRLENRSMASQQEIDDLTTALVDSEGRIQSEIADLEQQVANGQAIDLSGLKAAVAHAADLVPSVDPAPAPGDGGSGELPPPVSVDPPAPDGSVPPTDAPADPGSGDTPVNVEPQPDSPVVDGPASGDGSDGTSDSQPTA